MASRISTPARPQEQASPPIPDPTPAAPKPKRKYRTRGQGGSIYPRGKSWIAMYRDRDGRQQCKTFGSKAEARQHLTETLQAIRENKPVVAKPEFFSVFAARWLDARIPVLKPNSHRTYRSALVKWLLPAFGAAEMRDLSREDVVKFKDHLLRKHL